MPPASTTGNRLLSCVRPTNRLERNIRHELSSTVPSPSGMLSNFAARYRNGSTCHLRGNTPELIHVPARDGFVAVRVVVVRGGMVPLRHSQPRVVQGRQVARN